MGRISAPHAVSQLGSNICTIYEINESDDGQLYLEGETVTHAADALGYWVTSEWPATRPEVLMSLIQARKVTGQKLVRVG